MKPREDRVAGEFDPAGRLIALLLLVFDPWRGAGGYLERGRLTIYVPAEVAESVINAGFDDNRRAVPDLEGDRRKGERIDSYRTSGAAIW